MLLDSFTMSSCLAVENKLSKAMLLSAQRVQSNILNTFALKTVWTALIKTNNLIWTHKCQSEWKRFF